MEYIRITVTCVVAIGAGVILGNSAVVFFNRMPGKWLCEYGKEPDVPDQLIILLMIAAVGFVPYQDRGPFEGVWGGLIGFSVMLVIGILSKIIYRREGLGGGDIKLFGALGLCLGTDGILAVFVLSTFICAIHLACLLVTKKIKPR